MDAEVFLLSLFQIAAHPDRQEARRASDILIRHVGAAPVLESEDADDPEPDESEEDEIEEPEEDEETRESRRSEFLFEDCTPNKQGKGHHDTKTGRPCSPAGGAKPTSKDRPSTEPSVSPTSSTAKTDDASPDPAKGRPSRADERHVNEDGSAPLPPAKAWQAPPPKTGKKGEGMKARPKGDESQTKIGDLGEGLATQIGFRSILPEGQRSHKAGENEEKGSTIDLEFDHSGRGYELKLCNSTATEYRLKAKSKEKAQKEKYAALNDLTAHVLVGVRDVETGEIHFYAGKQPGLIGSEVSEKHYDYIGSVTP